MAATLPILLLGRLLVPTLTQEAVTSSQAISLQEAADIGAERLHQSLVTYAQTNTLSASAILSNFGAGQSQAITNLISQATDPESGLVVNTGIRVNAYVNQVRGDVMELASTAIQNDLQVSIRQWIHLDSCQYGSATPIVSTLLTNPGYGSPQIYVDAIHNRAIINDTANRTLLYRDATLLTTLLNGAISRLAQDSASGRIFFEATSGLTIYRLDPDNTLTSLPAMAPGSSYHGNLVVNPITGELITYRHSLTAGQRGLWSYNSTSGVSTQVAALNLGLLPALYTPRLLLNPNDGRVFVLPTTHLSLPVYSWATATGLDSLFNLYNADQGLVVNPATSRLYACDGNPLDYRVMTWAPATGSQTILGNGLLTGCAGLSVDTTRDRLYFQTTQLLNSSVYRWSSGDGLATIATTPLVLLGSYNMLDPDSGHYFFPNDQLEVMDYNPDTNSVSNLAPARFQPTARVVVPGNRSVLTNATLTGLEDYVSWLSMFQPVTVGNSPKVWMGGSDALYRWTPTQGLTTVLSLAGGSPGYNSGRNAPNINPDSATGNAFIGTQTANDYFYEAAGNRLYTLQGSGTNTYGSNYGNVNFATGRIYFMKGTGGSLQTVYTTQIQHVPCD